MGRVALVVWILAALLAPRALRADPSADALPASSEPEQGPLVIDEVFLGAGNLATFLQGLQWIEIANPGDQAVSLEGMTLRVGEAKGVPLDPSVTIPPGGFFVLVVTEDEALRWSLRMSSGLGFPFQVAAQAPLPKTASDLLVEGPAGLIDRVPLAGNDTWIAGHALSLDPSFLSPLGNNEPAAWCASSIKTSLAGHLVNGSPGALNPFCDNDADGYTEATGDCDDGLPGVHPTAPEVCDGLDNDCNGQTDDVQWVQDLAVTGCLQEGVCFGTAPSCGHAAWECAYPAEYQEEETACDGLDNDCDGQTDESLVNACGLCGDLTLEVCDGLDNDCDGQTDESLVVPKDLCASREGVCGEGVPQCLGGEGWVCAYPATHQVEETSCDGLDNDCDGLKDEGFPVGEFCLVEEGACRSSGTWGCSADHGGVRCDAPPVGLAWELCGDGVDNDCNGQTDEGFPLGEVCEVGAGACRVTGRRVCAEDRRSLVCDAAPLPPDTEICGDGLDNDCDGQSDEADCVAVKPVDPGTTELNGGATRGCQSGPAGSRGAGLVVLIALLGLGRARRRGTISPW